MGKERRTVENWGDEDGDDSNAVIRIHRSPRNYATIPVALLLNEQLDPWVFRAIGQIVEKTKHDCWAAHVNVLEPDDLKRLLTALQKAGCLEAAGFKHVPAEQSQAEIERGSALVWAEELEW